MALQMEVGERVFIAAEADLAAELPALVSPTFHEDPMMRMRISSDFNK